MGVKGLWKLLHPAARPVQLEQLSNKRLAVDASIWLHQFIKALKDKEGKTLNNAHILGFFRRICKFLFHDIKPVFVFDGGTPDLKRNTVIGRRTRRLKRQENVQRTAKKILAVQLHLNALNKEIENNNRSLTQGNATTSTTTTTTNTSLISSQPSDSSLNKEMRMAVSTYETRNSRDEYELPPEKKNLLSDYRFASEEELKELIQYDIDIDEILESDSFQDLPTEVQHRIIYEMKNKSRQHSYDRLEQMIKASSSALDFSKLQIQGVIQRNKLTEAMLQFNKEGSLKSGISNRIASERNNEYILIKNDDSEGGWSMMPKNKNNNTSHSKKSNELIESLLKKSSHIEDTLNKNINKELANSKKKYSSLNTYTKSTQNEKVIDLLSDNEEGNGSSSSSDDNEDELFEKFYNVNIPKLPNEEAKNVNEIVLPVSDFSFHFEKHIQEKLQGSEDKEEVVVEEENEKGEKDENNLLKSMNQRDKEAFESHKYLWESPPLSPNSGNRDENKMPPLDFTIDTNDSIFRMNEEKFIDHWVSLCSFEFKIEYPDFYSLITDATSTTELEDVYKELLDKHKENYKNGLDISAVHDPEIYDNYSMKEQADLFFEQFLLSVVKWRYNKLGKPIPLPTQNIKKEDEPKIKGFFFLRIN